MHFNFSGPGATAPQLGALVRGSVYIPSCMPGRPPIADYKFEGEFIGECADGFMTRPAKISDGRDPNDVGTIFTQTLWDAASTA